MEQQKKEQKIQDELKKGVSISNDKKSFVVVDDDPIKKGEK